MTRRTTGTNKMPRKLTERQKSTLWRLVKDNQVPVSTNAVTRYLFAGEVTPRNRKRAIETLQALSSRGLVSMARAGNKLSPLGRALLSEVFDVCSECMRPSEHSVCPKCRAAGG